MGLYEILAALASIGMDLGGAIAGSIPGPMEAKYRKGIKSDMERLGNGGGGMGAGKLQELQGMARSGVQAQQAEAQAQLARGGAGGAGTSGLQGQAMAGLNKNALGAMRGASSDIRAQDLAYAGQQRADLFRRQENAMGLGQAAKAGWQNAKASPRSEAQASNLGAGGQEDLISGLSQLNG